MLKIGDRVRVIAAWSVFHGYEGVVTLIHDTGMLPVIVQLARDGCTSPFSANELEVLP